MTRAKRDLARVSMASELAFLEDWVSGQTEYPVCACYTRDLYQAYLRWCRLTGEVRPRNERVFLSSIRHQPGWEVRELRVRRSDGDSTSVNTPMLVPPDSVYEALKARGVDVNGVEYRPEMLVSEWATHCFRLFRRALNEGDG